MRYELLEKLLNRKHLVTYLAGGRCITLIITKPVSCKDPLEGIDELGTFYNNGGDGFLEVRELGFEGVEDVG